MNTRSCRLSILVACGCLFACHGSDRMFDSQAIRSEEITVDQLPTEFDDSRTFSTGQVVEDPVGELTALLDAGIPVSRAWKPLDDRCFNPIGARFTVELLQDDPRILDRGFQRGVGSLGCATRLIAYTVVSSGG